MSNVTTNISGPAARTAFGRPVSTRPSWGRLAAAVVAAAAGSALANTLVRLVAVSVMDVPHAFEPLHAGAPAISSVVAAVGAGVVLAVLALVTRRPARAFLVVSAVVLVLSFGPVIQLGLADPPEYPGTTGGTLAALAVMHVVSAAIVVPLLATVPFRSRAGA